jgi:hypothetical protein
MPNEVSFVKKTYSIREHQNVIDSNFSEFVTPEIDVPDTDITVSEFFEFYDQLFYDIPVDGAINSHVYLVQQSQQYIGGSVVDLEKQALIEEINSLRQQLLDLNQTFTSINNLI